MLYYNGAEGDPLPEAGQFVLGKGLITLKARLVGIEDGESLVCQQLWLIHLRDRGREAEAEAEKRRLEAEPELTASGGCCSYFRSASSRYCPH